MCEPLTPLQRACRSTIWASSELISSCCLRQSSTFRASSSDKSTTCLLADAETHKSHKFPCAWLIILIFIDWSKTVTLTELIHTHHHQLLFLLLVDWCLRWELSSLQKKLLIINYHMWCWTAVLKTVCNVQRRTAYCTIYFQISE